MKVTFIYHSCYFVELEHSCLLFDYFQGEIPQIDKPLYVFVSHSHDDHFSPEVFRLAENGRDVRFLLSGDIPAHKIPESVKDRTVSVFPHQFYEVGSVRAATLESTDLGVAFLVECEGKRFYHAGDLNCWVWDGAPKFQNDLMKQQYQHELEHLSGKQIDVSFVPLDPRQGADFDLGMKYFLEAAQTRYVFPMHMWENYSVVPLFKADPTYRRYAGQVMDVSKPGQVFELPL